MPSGSASASLPSDKPPVTYLGSMHTIYLVGISMFDCGSTIPVSPSLPLVPELGRIALPQNVSVFQGFRVRAKVCAVGAKTVNDVK